MQNAGFRKDKSRHEHAVHGYSYHTPIHRRRRGADCRRRRIGGENSGYKIEVRGDPGGPGTVTNVHSRGEAVARERGRGRHGGARRVGRGGPPTPSGGGLVDRPPERDAPTPGRQRAPGGGIHGAVRIPARDPRSRAGGGGADGNGKRGRPVNLRRGSDTALTGAPGSVRWDGGVDRGSDVCRPDNRRGNRERAEGGRAAGGASVCQGVRRHGGGGGGDVARGNERGAGVVGDPAAYDVGGAGGKARQGARRGIE